MTARSFTIATLLVTLCGLESVAPAANLVPQTQAARYGLKRAWFAQVSAQRSSGPIEYVSLAGHRLLVQTRRNRVAALDAETGRILWAIQAGPANHVSTEPAANENYVVLVNGSVLYVVEIATGKLLWERKVGATPGAGPGITQTHVFVPMISGQIEGYDLEKGARQTPWFYKSAGRVLTPPVVTATGVNWTTEQGHLYVAAPDATGIRYRLETRDQVHARPAYWTPNLYACSTDGYVYAVNEAAGKIVWKFSVGDAVYAAPVAVEDKVYVISELDGMYCLDGKRGTRLWFAPKIRQFLAVSPARVYAVDQVGRMVILDAGSGARMAAMPLEPGGVRLVNGHTDRIYLANDSGVVQCLHESTLNEPVVYTPPPPPEVELPQVKASGEKREQPLESTEEMPEEDLDAEAPAMEDESPEAPADDADDPFK